VIYVDSSIVLAWLLAEDVRPPAELWSRSLASSRLLEYEVWTVLHKRDLARAYGSVAGGLLGRIALLEMSSIVLERALKAFPVSLRTLDSLHLASLEYLTGRGQYVELATYDRRMLAAAEAMGVRLYGLNR